MDFETLWKIFKGLALDGLVMNHYDLAEHTEENNPDVWKQFLLSQEVAEYIEIEMRIMQGSELNKMLKDISKSNSVGQAQLMNALSKLSEGSGIKDGPIFIYTYVPLSTEQTQASNVVIEKEDIFVPRRM